MAREYFCAYHSFLESLTPYDDAEVGRLFRACLQYSMTGEEPDLSGNERFIWPTMRQQIDRDITAYSITCAKNRENGGKGGRPPKTVKTERFSENPTVILETQKSQGKEEGEEEEKEKDEIEENVEKKKPRPARFVPPSFEEVSSYCLERGSEIDPQHFFDYYTSNGWKVGKNCMRDWKAAVRTWESKEAKKGGRNGQGRDSANDRARRLGIVYDVC